MGLKDFFFETTEDDKKTKEKPQSEKSGIPKIPGSNNAPSIQFTETAQTVNTVYNVPSSGISTDDLSKFNKHFDDLFEQANLPGPDYYEFSKMCQAMTTLTDDQKYPAAFMGLQVQGLTKQKLIESTTHYIAIIDDDAKNFSSVIDGKLMAEVTTKRQAADAKKASIAQKEEMIKNLQADILKDNQEMMNLSNEANEQERKANEKANVYKIACEARKNSINTDLQKINTYLK